VVVVDSWLASKDRARTPVIGVWVECMSTCFTQRRGDVSLRLGDNRKPTSIRTKVRLRVTDPI
jgi:hypothetical protein